MTELQASDDRAIRDARSRIQVDAIEASIEPADAVPGALRALSPANPVKSVAVAPPVHPGGSPSLEARAPTDASAGPQPGLGPRVDVGVAAMDDWTPTRIEVLSVPLEPAEAPAREGTDPVARREHALQVSTQIAELLAERVIARIRQGHWQVRLMLSPARLGFIDVQLEMRRGALEATFTASQASTREVLADNLWRLRDTLSESGMLIANMSLASDLNGHSGGFLTPQRHYRGIASPSDAALNEPSIIPTTDTPPQGLLDVRV
jgi:flagellar hook-length control protein FliK